MSIQSVLNFNFKSSFQKLMRLEKSQIYRLMILISLVGAALYYLKSQKSRLSQIFKYQITPLNDNTHWTKMSQHQIRTVATKIQTLYQNTSATGFVILIKTYHNFSVTPYYTPFNGLQECSGSCPLCTSTQSQSIPTGNTAHEFFLVQSLGNRPLIIDKKTIQRNWTQMTLDAQVNMIQAAQKVAQHIETWLNMDLSSSHLELHCDSGCQTIGHTHLREELTQRLSNQQWGALREQPIANRARCKKQIARR